MAAAAPDREELREAWKRAEAERGFWRKHYGRFLELYPEQFVAVHRRRVVATSPDLLQLLALIEDKKIALADTWVQFMTADPRHTTL